MKSSIERVEWPRVQMVCGWAMSLDPGQGVFPVHGDVVGPVAADLVLRRVFAGPAGVALVAGIGGMHLDDGAADPAGLGVPADVIIDLESGCHGRLLRTGVPVFCDRQRRGRLCRQSAGRPPVPGLGWRDRQPRTGGELWKPWNCIAADCWIMCNWWCAICPPLNASIPLSPPGWAYRSAGVARVLSGSMSWCSRRWTRRRHSASPQGVTIWPSRRRTGRPWRRFTRRRWPPGGGTTAHRDCGPIIRTITPLSCWIPTATISRWSITAPPGAVRLRYRSPSTFSREPEPGGKESTAAVN